MQEPPADKQQGRRKKRLPQGPGLIDRAIALPHEALFARFERFDCPRNQSKWPRIEGVFKEVVAWSDLHSDMGTNMVHLKQLPVRKETVLLLAGDVASSMDTIESSMRILLSKFGAVFYVPGNHELWVKKEDGLTSAHKFLAIIELCERLGVHTRPAQISYNCAICPLFSWYKDNLVDGFHRDMANIPFDMHTMWPWDLTGRGDQNDAQQHEIADFFFRLNERRVKTAPQEANQNQHARLQGIKLNAFEEIRSRKVISMSHFVPRQEVYPGPRRLCGVMGCREIEAQVRTVGASCHIFGHSHIAVDKVIDVVRYVQHPLGYPNDYHRKVNPLQVYLDGKPTVAENGSEDEVLGPTLHHKIFESIANEIKNSPEKEIKRPPGRWETGGGWDDRPIYDRTAEYALRVELQFDSERARREFWSNNLQATEEEPPADATTEEQVEEEELEIEMVIFIDRDLDLYQTTKVLKGCTVAELKQCMASEDPTGQSQAADIGLRRRMPDGKSRLLKDEEFILGDVLELDMCGVDGG